MTVSKTTRLSALLSATAAAIVVGFVACPGNHSSKKKLPVVALLSVDVTPPEPTIALGTTLQFTATGNYSDGTTADLTGLADWTSSDAAAGEVSMAAGSRGLATALATGSTAITATYSGKSGSTTLTVSGADLVSIEVTPTNPQIALGTSAQFAATGTFTDGTTQDLTAQVLWESSAAGAATISNAAASHGLAQSVGLGDTTITATFSGTSGSTTLTVTSAILVSLEVSHTSPCASETTKSFTKRADRPTGSRMCSVRASLSPAASAPVCTNSPSVRSPRSRMPSVEATTR